MEELFDLASLAAAPLYECSSRSSRSGRSSSSGSRCDLQEGNNNDATVVPSDRTVPSILSHHSSKSVPSDKEVRSSYGDVHQYVSGRSHELTKLMNQFDELMSELAPQQESGSPLLSRTSPSTSRGTKRNNKGMELTINEESLPALPSESKDPPRCVFTSSSSQSLVHSIEELMDGVIPATAIDISSPKKAVVACRNRNEVETEESSECKQEDSGIPSAIFQNHRLDVSSVIPRQIQAQESIDKEHEIQKLESTNRTLLLSLQEERSLRAISDEQRQRALEEIAEVTRPINNLLTTLSVNRLTHSVNKLTNPTMCTVVSSPSYCSCLLLPYKIHILLRFKCNPN